MTGLKVSKRKNDRKTKTDRKGKKREKLKDRFFICYGSIPLK